MMDGIPVAVLRARHTYRLSFCPMGLGLEGGWREGRENEGDGEGERGERQQGREGRGREGALPSALAS